MNIGDLIFSLRGDGTALKADAIKAAGDAGDAGGKTFSDGFNKAAKKAQGNFSQGIAAGIGAGVGLAAFGALKEGVQAVASAIGDSVGAANKFEDQLRTINTVAHVSDTQLAAIGTSIQDLAKQTGKSTDDLTAGFYDLVSAGIPADKAIKVLHDSAILATGALGTTGEAVDLVTSALNAYGMQAEESTRVTDIFAQAVADGKVTAAELGQTIATIAPIAASAGVKLTEVAAGFALLTVKGVPAAQAATQMRAAISALLTPNVTLIALQKKLGQSFADVARAKGLSVALDELRSATNGNDDQFAKALGSIEAYSYALATTGDNAAAAAIELGKITAGANAGGVALGQYTEKSKSQVEQQKRLDEEVQVFQQHIGALIAPLGTLLVGAATAAFGAIDTLAKSFRDLERWMSPHLALIDDEITLMDQLGKSQGINVATIEASVKAQRDLERAQKDQADATKVAITNWRNLVGIGQDEVLTGARLEEQTAAVNDELKNQGLMVGTITSAAEAQATKLADVQRQWKDYAATQNDVTAAAIMLQTNEAAANTEVLARMMASRISYVDAVAQIRIEQARGDFKWVSDYWGPGMAANLGAAGLAAGKAGAAGLAAGLNFGTMFGGSGQRSTWKDPIALLATRIRHDSLPALGDAFAAVGSLITASFKTIPSKVKGHADRIKVVWHHALHAILSDTKLRMKEVADAMANPHRWNQTRKALVSAMEKAQRAMNRAHKAGNVEAYALADAQYEYLKGRVADMDALKATIHVAWAVEDLQKILRQAGGSGGRGQFTQPTHKKPKRQEFGGPAHRGVPYIVGERRPELFVPDQNGTILPSLGGSRTLNVIVTSPDGSMARSGMSTADLANSIRRWDD